MSFDIKVLERMILEYGFELKLKYCEKKDKIVYQLNSPVAEFQSLEKCMDWIDLEFDSK